MLPRFAALTALPCTLACGSPPRGWSVRLAPDGAIEARDPSLTGMWQGLSLQAPPGPPEPDCASLPPRPDGPACIRDRSTGGGSHSSSSTFAAELAASLRLVEREHGWTCPPGNPEWGGFDLPGR
ncbi:MAG: hypothetical protein AAF602_23725 [Myxococcota bacterium]